MVALTGRRRGDPRRHVLALLRRDEPARAVFGRMLVLSHERGPVRQGRDRAGSNFADEAFPVR
jgi:hypothetical protein